MAAGKASSPWMKRGNTGSNSLAPGSYGGWFKLRKPPKAYPTTAHQHRIGDAGRQVGQECTGKRGSEWFRCRSGVLAGVRKR